MWHMGSKGRFYFIGDGGGRVTPAQLRRAKRERQIEVMRSWFYENYETPDTLPYESAEGGYQWIWGGPYDPREELEDEFDGIVRESAIKELAGELTNIAWEWSGNSDRFRSDEEDYLDEFVPSQFSNLDTFLMSLHNVELLLNLHPPDDDLKKYLHRMYFANVITAFETYLADTFIAAINEKKELLERFVETNTDFQHEKFPLSELFKRSREIEKRTTLYLRNLVWHNLGRIMPMYKATLDVTFPSDLDAVHKAIVDRHDIVHRNGKSPDGREGSWGEKDIRELMKAITAVVKELERQLKKVGVGSSVADPLLKELHAGSLP